MLETGKVMVNPVWETIRHDQEQRCIIEGSTILEHNRESENEEREEECLSEASKVVYLWKTNGKLL